jgi:hypothetical protein
MPRKLSAPTREVADRIVHAIMGGAYEYVAAEAAGVRRERYAAWLERGRRKGSRPALRDFADRVMRAKAHARVVAETQVRQKDPKTWLLRGPGRERPDSPGWSKEVSPQSGRDPRAVNPLADPALSALMAVIMDALADHPEARQRVAATLYALPSERGASAQTP